MYLNVRTNLPKNMWSAEISSISAFKFNKDNKIEEDIVIALFSTETEDGKFCAEVNKKVLEKLGWCKVLDPIPITGLKTKSKDKPNEVVSKNFIEIGLIKLNEEVDKLLKNKEYKQNYFNITGGFKSIIPIATIIAFEREMSLIYLYEESDDLIVMKPPPKGNFKCSFEEAIKGMILYGFPPGA
jgi:putative CRISPR-associated protein (TIGR02619 family)